MRQPWTDEEVIDLITLYRFYVENDVSKPIRKIADKITNHSYESVRNKVALLREKGIIL